MQTSAKPKEKEALLVINKAQSYKYCHQPLLSQDKTLAIQEKLTLEKSAAHNTKQRQTRADFYWKYNINPFVEYKPGASSNLKKYLKEKNLAVVSITDKLGETKVKEHDIRSDFSGKSAALKELKVTYSMLSDKLINVVENENKKQLNPPEEKPIESENTQSNYAQICNILEKEVPLQENLEYFRHQGLDQILTIKEENVFFKPERRLNIFRVAHGEDEELSSRQVLKKFYFCNDAMVEKISKIKIPIYRDISSLGRKTILGENTSPENIIDFVDSYELSFKLKQLFFYDILSVASNRLSPDFLYKMLNFEEVVAKDKSSETSSEKQFDKAIIYRNGETNQEANFINVNEEKQEISDYQMLGLNEAENEYMQECSKKQRSILNNLELKRGLLLRTVDDYILSENIYDKVKRQFADFVEMDKNNVDTDRLVRMNKFSKNQNEQSKMKTLLQTLASKNKHQSMLKHKQNK